MTSLAKPAGMWMDPGYGYNVDVTNDVAKGNEPESLYAVMSGTHYNGECCFDCEPAFHVLCVAG